MTTMRNVHGTAVMIGETGFLFVGPSGRGKSLRAFECLAQAQARQMNAVLVADDQVLVFVRDGQLIARCPPALAGLLELRGSGIITMAYREEAPLHFAVLPVDLSAAERLPPDEERHVLFETTSLPLIRLPAATCMPLDVLMMQAACKGA